ncbi:factor VIII intron 22 protein [Paragonimus westermani]|uniref:Factor VIII intron 22 protein n=1 Tax=Paragonimus westermani TaxID=34504 RepID=A0A5J4NGV2_9TREM|nr:factor VIII intron 22 protein [Paragonimus westermani]
MDIDLDYAHIYKTLNSDVKRGFFRKSSRGCGSSDAFACVSKNLAAQECSDLAAIFLLGKAKCESAANNTLAEASSLFTAARHFLQTEDKLDRINAVSYEENLDCSTMCLLRTAKIYESGELFTLAASVYTYLSDSLMHRRRWCEAMPHLKRLSEILGRDLVCHLQVLYKMVRCQLRLRDWPGALTTCLRMQVLLENTDCGSCFVELRSHYWTTTEVLRVILVLLTTVLCTFNNAPVSFQPPHKLTNLLQSAYSLDSYTEGIGLGGGLTQFNVLDERIFLYLQSLILAYRAGDIIEVEMTLGTLQSFLDLEQRDLVQPLLDGFTNPMGNMTQ